MPETLPPLDREEKEGITRFWEFGQATIREVCAKMDCLISWTSNLPQRENPLRFFGTNLII